MSFKDTLGSMMKQANNYLGNNNIKEKVLEMKDKTVDKVKGIDNPEHYTAPEGFELFKVPVAMSTPEITKTLEQIEPFSLKEQDKVIDAYVRMLSLLKAKETIQNAIIASMKKPYLIVWTSQDRLLIVHKEHYKIYTREEMNTFKVTGTSTFGLAFRLNQYDFVGSEKSKTYCFIRKYCHEYTKEYEFVPYLSISRNLNYYERFKYSVLEKENKAIGENKQLSILFDPLEFPLVSVYGTFLNTTYVLALTTNGKLYMINEKEYAVVNKTDIKEISLTNKGIFSYEFYFDNYYFTGSGPEVSVLALIQYIRNSESFEEAKNAYLNAHQVFITFPFKGATAYQTPGGEEIVISATKSSFLIAHGFGEMEMYQNTEFDHYEFVGDFGVSKEEIWKELKEKDKNKTLSKKDAIENFDKIKVLLYTTKSEEPVIELPFILLKKVVYQEIEQTVSPGKIVTKELLDTLDYFKSMK